MKEARGTAPEVGDLAEVEEGRNKMSQTVQQKQAVFRVYWEVPDILRNNTLRVSKCVGCKHITPVNTSRLLRGKYY